MNAPKLHLNLLRDSERQSSSPVRLRVMLPILAALACVGCLVWWGVLAGQLILAKAKVSSLQADLDAKKAAHSGILKQMGDARELQAELDQLKDEVITMYNQTEDKTCSNYLQMAFNELEKIQQLNDVP